MLVLSRKIGDKVKIFKEGDPSNPLCEITILGVDRSQLKLGFVADTSYIILRDELVGIPFKRTKPALKHEKNKEKMPKMASNF